MRRRFWARPSWLAFALLACASAHAQPSAAPGAPAALEHPLRRGFDAAWERQPERLSAPLRRDAVDAARHSAQRWTADAPALELTGKTDRLNRNAGSREVDATVAIPLWLPGERSRSLAAADAQAHELDARLSATRLTLAEQVRSIYWEHVRARQEHQLAEERLRHARSLADDVTRRLKAGDLAQADAHQADGAVAAAESTVAEAKAAASRAARKWQTLTGLSMPPEADAFAEPLPAASETHTAHPALRALSAQAESARRQRDLASAQRWANPELALGAVRERGAAGERYEQSVVLGIRVPLGRNSGSQARLATASADQLEAETTLTREVQRVDADVAAARDDVNALRSSFEAADKRARLARESRGFFEKSFRLGEADLPTRLRVDLEAFEAERQAARARTELSAAISALRQAMGLLPE